LVKRSKVGQPEECSNIKVLLVKILDPYSQPPPIVLRKPSLKSRQKMSEQLDGEDNKNEEIETPTVRMSRSSSNIGAQFVGVDNKT
jgi:hypothetical protein